MNALELEKVSLNDKKILGLFVNTLIADGKYSLLKQANLTQRIQMQSCNEQTVLSRFSSAFLKSRLNFQFFEKNPHWVITLIAYVFPELQTANNMVRQISKKFKFRRPFDKRLSLKASTFTTFINHCEDN